ncbi:hypothetical protein EJ02DRAFT_423741 [Clathrospora elynae]|uniref:Uncharacterized protein n=1 Tax=Clathrospora elynae TaxID=706981 RepID=A0A6A5SPV0_9PLEO|nr:hypothetical protein EJ02DRAFT_423741 [Clathrospora elynae]
MSYCTIPANVPCGCLTTTSPSLTSISALGTPPQMPTISANWIFLNVACICVATVAAGLLLIRCYNPKQLATRWQPGRVQQSDSRAINISSDPMSIVSNKSNVSNRFQQV